MEDNSRWGIINKKNEILQNLVFTLKSKLTQKDGPSPWVFSDLPPLICVRHRGKFLYFGNFPAYKGTRMPQVHT